MTGKQAPAWISGYRCRFSAGTPGTTIKQCENRNSDMIILLNGTSSSGKTTVAKILQEKYEGVLLLYGIDTLVQTAFPEKCDYPPYDEQAIKATFREVDGHPHATLTVMPYIYPVYRAAVEFCRNLSERGYDLIVDEVLFDAGRVTQYFEVLDREKVYFIGIKPERDVVVQREKDRGDRVPGLAAGLYDAAYHPLFSYDLTLDTGVLTPEEAADKILAYIAQNDSPQGFARSARDWMAKQERDSGRAGL
jgi:chloramphenicol 3-O phosphotransferase